MTLPFGTELAAGTLRALARRQGSVFDSDRAEAPGKMPHELRRTTFTDPAAGLALPPVYYGTIDATPLWSCLLHDAWKWGLAGCLVEKLLPNLQAATRWLTELASPEADGLLRYIDTSSEGLANQGGRTPPTRSAGATVTSVQVFWIARCHIRPHVVRRPGRPLPQRS